MSRRATSALGRVAAGLALTFAFAVVHAANIVLDGVDGTGFLALSGVNSESVEPNSGLPGSKNFAYPYYLDPATGLYDMIVAEKLSADSTYAQESFGPVFNKTVTDADFALFSLGSLTFDSTLVNPSGISVLAPGQFTLGLDASDYAPLGTPRNVNNEFAWTYVLTPSNLRGPGLEFTDGQLTSIDLVADVQVDVLLLGNPTFPFTPGFFQADGLTINGNRFAFDMDVAVAQQSVFGQLDARLEFTRAGTIGAVVPLPAGLPLLGSGLFGLLGLARRRGAKVAKTVPGG